MSRSDVVTHHTPVTREQVPTPTGPTLGARFRSLCALALALCAATLVLVVLCAASPARADSLVFAKPDGNIYLANSDGSGQYQVTLDGTPSDPYFSPSQTAGGVIEAGHGTGSSGQIVQLTQNGTVLNQYTSAAPGGPLDPVVSPDGQLVAYYAFTAVDDCYPWICVGGATAQLVGAADHFVDPSTYINEGTGFNHGVWVSDTRLLLFHHNGTMWFYDVGASEPFQWGGLISGLNPNLDWFFEGAASSDDARLAVITGSPIFNTPLTAYIQLLGTAGDLATATDPTLPTYGCTIPAPDGSNGYQGNPNSQQYLFSSVSWSPNGQSLAFAYNGAIYVAHIPDVSDCSTITVSQVIASGSSPFWSAANIDPGSRSTGGTTSGSGGSTSGSGGSTSGSGGSTSGSGGSTSGSGGSTSGSGGSTSGSGGGSTSIGGAGGARSGACSGLKGTALQNCQAKGTYGAQLAACSKRRSKGAGVRCRRAAVVDYRRALAVVKCEQVANKRRRAACLARAAKTR